MRISAHIQAASPHIFTSQFSLEAMGGLRSATVIKRGMKSDNRMEYPPKPTRLVLILPKTIKR